MKKVVIYSRFSSEMQDERSIDDQERTCEEFALRQGWTVIGTFADRGISGASLVTRPEMQRLMKAAEAGMFDVVLSEALDRVSRDIEDTSKIFKTLTHHDVVLHTLSEGVVDEMHVGLKGTMNALFLKDLKRKTHRGLQGRALKGKSAGGKAYGYDVVRSIDAATGEAVTGERTINEFEAAVVRRIFTDYVRGKSPRKIAFELNDEGIAAPTGGTWGASTINGNRQRGTGIINNELYVGRQVWNRLRYLKDPSTGKRVSKLNAESEWIIADVPELRIVDQELWDKVKVDQGALDRSKAPNKKRRPVHLLSFLLKCGECRGGMSIVSHGRYGCSTSRNKGTCENRTTICKDELEGSVLEAMQSRLMNPEMTKLFCEEYTRHLNKIRMERNSSLALHQKELSKIERDLEKTYQAMLDGMASDFVRKRFEELETRKGQVEHFLDTTEEAPVLVHPNMALRYASAIGELMSSFNSPEHKAEAAKTIRSLLDEIVLTPNEDRSELIVDMKGDLAAILSVADARAKSAKPKAVDQMETSERKELEQVESMIVSPLHDTGSCALAGPRRNFTFAVKEMNKASSRNHLSLAGDESRKGMDNTGPRNQNSKHIFQASCTKPSAIETQSVSASLASRSSSPSSRAMRPDPKDTPRSGQSFSARKMRASRSALTSMRPTKRSRSSNG